MCAFLTNLNKKLFSFFICFGRNWPLAFTLVKWSLVWLENVCHATAFLATRSTWPAELRPPENRAKSTSLRPPTTAWWRTRIMIQILSSPTEVLCWWKGEWNQWKFGFSLAFQLSLRMSEWVTEFKKVYSRHQRTLFWIDCLKFVLYSVPHRFSDYYNSSFLLVEQITWAQINTFFLLHLHSNA